MKQLDLGILPPIPQYELIAKISRRPTRRIEGVGRIYRASQRGMTWMQFRVGRVLFCA